MDRRSAIRAGHPDLGRARKTDIGARESRLKGPCVRTLEREVTTDRPNPFPPKPLDLISSNWHKLLIKHRVRTAIRLDASAARRYERLDVCFDRKP